MKPCPECGGMIALEAAICKHCGASIAKPMIPVGVKIVGILSILGGLGILGQTFGSFPVALLFGIEIPLGLAKVIRGAVGLGSIALGVGLLRQMEIARRYGLWFLVITTIEGAASVVYLASEISSLYGYMADDIVNQLYGGAAMNVLINGYIVYYLVKKKDYFTQ